MKYEDSGVIFDMMDPFKRAAQLAARETAVHLTAHGFRELEWTRGESVYVVQQAATFYGPETLMIGFVVEGLGTKNVIPDRVRQQAQLLDIAVKMDEQDTRRISSVVAVCNAAMVFNDMATLGIQPVVFGQHLATGSSEWFNDQARWQGYIDGTVQACNQVGCTWGCGETPTIKGIIYPEAAELSGASWGTCKKRHLISCNIQDGDRIVLVSSTGIHANGLTMARNIADKFARGYFTLMDDGQTFGDGLLQPTTLYGPFVRSSQENGADIHYAVNITGHGWRKLMRAIEPFVYVIEKIPEPQAVFRFIQKYGNVSTRDMYADFNMGAGFALFMPAESVKTARRAVIDQDLEIWDAGHIEKRGDEKRLELRPIGEVFEGSELTVR